MKKIFLLIIFIFLFSYIFISPVKANQPEINLYFFYGDSCPHCAKEEIFLLKLKDKYPNIIINKFETYHNSENQEFYKQFVKKLNVSRTGVPLLIIEDEYVIGYGSDEITGKKIEEIIKRYLDTSNEENNSPVLISIPFIGEINARNFSLPFLTFIIAATDGFNPCAMWVLIFLISLLLGMQDKKRMWILGMTFIFSSGTVYFLFLSAWLNLFLFIGFVFWVRILIGFVAVASGSYHVYDYLNNKNGSCRVTGNEKRKKIFCKIQKIITEQKLWLALLGIIILAVAVNLVELVCSAGLPAVFAQILTVSNLPVWQYYIYLVFYILIFMLDDMLIFVIAMKTLELKGINTKYTKYANLIGGIIIFILGILLIFKPEWIMF
ncbi:hypothetical protein KAI92_01115 [Candidatus Parcubacteria bacterium]|nr:hypothetical protein [Candidatus Parcubacteria bacterium]